MSWIRRHAHFWAKRDEDGDVTVDIGAFGLRAILLAGLWHFWVVLGRQGGPTWSMFLGPKEVR